MDKQKFATLAIGIKSAYPASKILEDNASMDFWYMMLKDIPYEIAENAVMEYICTSVFPPNIAEIRKLCMDRCKKPVLSFDDAWGSVQKAIREYGFYGAEKAFASFDELTLSIVKNLGWSNLCLNENVDASRANFRMAYEAKAKEAQNINQLPDFVVNNKAMLQQQYTPKIESSPLARIESNDTKVEVINSLGQEQINDRARQLAELKKRMIGG
nr:MAG TPA: replisome organizer [Caudoviricetes sp.]